MVSRLTPARFASSPIVSRDIAMISSRKRRADTRGPERGFLGSRAGAARAKPAVDDDRRNRANAEAPRVRRDRRIAHIEHLDFARTARDSPYHRDRLVAQSASRAEHLDAPFACHKGHLLTSMSLHPVRGYKVKRSASKRTGDGQVSP